MSSLLANVFILVKLGSTGLTPTQEGKREEEEQSPL